MPILGGIILGLCIAINSITIGTVIDNHTQKPQPTVTVTTPAKYEAKEVIKNFAKAITRGMVR